MRGNGKTDLMLRTALSAARWGDSVLVEMESDGMISVAKEILPRIAKRMALSDEDSRAAIDRVTFVSSAGRLAARMRGRQFDRHFADHTVLAKRLPRVEGDDWMR